MRLTRHAFYKQATLTLAVAAEGMAGDCFCPVPFHSDKPQPSEVVE